MLGDSALVGFVAATDRDAARAFYGGVLGLRVASEDPFALVFDAHGTQLRVAMVEKLTPAPYTVLGWQVADLRAAVADLGARGVAFERYEGMGQDAAGIWWPGEHGVAWFKDPFGNLLSVSGGRAGS